MNTVKSTLLLGALTGLLLFMGTLVGGRGGLMLALVMATVMNFGAYFWSHKIVLRAYHAQPVSPEEAPGLYRIVERLALKANIPVPALYVIPDPALNAFATGRNPKHAVVAVTEGILQAMDEEELEGVLAHELSHVLNRDTLISTIAATLGGAVTSLAYWFMFLGHGDEEEGGGGLLGGLAMMILAPIAATLIQLAISRSREYEADATGARIVGYPDGLARALAKLQQASEQIPMHRADPASAHLFIVNPLSGGGFASLFATHPPLGDRIARLLGHRS